MITPRRTRLVRVSDLHAFRETIVSLCADYERADASSRAADARPSTAVVVPTHGAARQLRSRIEGVALATREELYEHLHTRLMDPPRRLTAIERHVLASAAARDAARDHEVSFRLRPGLVAEVLRFHDQVRRQTQQIDRFEELLDAALGSGDIDRGAARLRQQTRFLAGAFREYDRRVRESGGCDEHLLRERLIAVAAPAPLRHVVVTVADWIADADGLFVADFDLLARMPGLATIDIVSTDALLASGFDERLANWWPGLETEQAPGSRRQMPLLSVPPGASPDEPWWTYRDREEELVAFVRKLKADHQNGDGSTVDRTAVVFKHPLPYLYLAREVFGAASVEYQASDGLPLATEPVVAALDLVLDAASSNFTRDSLVALLRSPHLVFRDDGVEIPPESVSALNRSLSDLRYLGTVEKLEALSNGWRHSNAAPALRAALAAARELSKLREPDSASAQTARLQAFWDAHLRADDERSPYAARERRARAAVADVLSALASVHAAFDDPLWTVDELALAFKRAIEEQTFGPDAAGTGVHLLDDQAARYGDFDDVTIVGVVDPDWPDKPHRNIFYPPGLLKSLGWPSERDRRAAADARFLDLLASASSRTTVSVFTLDEDSLVPRSVQLDEIPRARLSAISRPPDAPARVFVDEALSLEPVILESLNDTARTWADLRMSRTDALESRFHGSLSSASSVESPALNRVPTVSSLETYLDCPFKYFARYVLRLDEEPDDEEVMDPRREGQFIHRVFEQFFAAWQAAGHGAITPATLAAARDMFGRVVERLLGELGEAEGGLARTRLLGSSAASGLGEAVIRMEAERPIPVLRRLLEYDVNGRFIFATEGGPRTIELRGKADRVDLLADGTFRLIDYKLGWPPDRGTALQLPIYSVCAQQQLERVEGRTWRLGEAAYLAFKGPRRVVPLFKTPEDRDEVLGAAQQRLADTVDKIAAGEFPPTPTDVFECERCSYTAVCRKDYVGDV